MSSTHDTDVVAALDYSFDIVHHYEDFFQAQNVKADQHFCLEVFNNVNLSFYDSSSDFII